MSDAWTQELSKAFNVWWEATLAAPENLAFLVTREGTGNYLFRYIAFFVVIFFVASLASLFGDATKDDDPIN